MAVYTHNIYLTILNGPALVCRVELWPDFIHRFFTFYFLHKALHYGIWVRLVTTSGFKAINRFIKVYEDPVLLVQGELFANELNLILPKSDG